MKRVVFYVLVTTTLLLVTCEKEEELKICGSNCSSNTPWTVESLDPGLPCFTTKAECRTQADAHGYGDKTCIQCN